MRLSGCRWPSYTGAPGGIYPVEAEGRCRRHIDSLVQAKWWRRTGVSSVGGPGGRD